MKKLILPILLFTCCLHTIYGQHKLDSLLGLIKADKDDSNKVNHYNAISSYCRSSGKLDEAVSYARIGMALALKINYLRGAAKEYNIIGNVNSDKADFPVALDNYLNSLKLYQQINDEPEIAKLTGNIGGVYRAMGYYPKALENDLKSRDMYKALNMNSGVALATGNIGNIYDDMHEYDTALQYDFDALNVYTKLADKANIARNTGNIGNVYDDKADYDKALEYDMKSLEMYKQLNDKYGIARNTGNIGDVYVKTHKNELAVKYLESAIALCDSIRFVSAEKEFDKSLSTLYREMGQWEKAFNYYQQYTAIKDSLVNEEKSKEIGHLEAKADFDKQLLIQNAAHEKETALAEADSKRQKALIALVTAIALAIAIIAIIVSRSLQLTRRQKTEIESQKKIVEEQNTEIKDSILYAKRLQDAILPPLSTIETLLPESFVLYMPKDIVAGDFYWVTTHPLLPASVLIAACDCTGHGVPGALVSVVCSNALDRAVKEFNITAPGKILDKTRDLVIETFEKSGEDVLDGMDISLAGINMNTLEINWSGAYNSSWIITRPIGNRKDISTIELVADKQPIGKTDRPRPFSNFQVKLNKGDTIYLLTDGYADQFGGPKGKKFKYKQLQEKLLAVNAMSMSKQKEALEQVLNEWKGKLNQVDDILIIGIRV